MDMMDEDLKQLLTDDEQLLHEPRCPIRKASRICTSRAREIMLIGCLIFSLILNIAMGLSSSGISSLLSNYQELPSQLSEPLGSNVFSTHWKVARPMRSLVLPMMRDTVYWSEDEQMRDKAWRALSIEPGVVALDPDVISQNQLIQGRGFPWDKNKGVYVLNASITLYGMCSVSNHIPEILSLSTCTFS